MGWSGETEESRRAGQRQVVHLQNLVALASYAMHQGYQEPKVDVGAMKILELEDIDDDEYCK